MPVSLVVVVQQLAMVFVATLAMSITLGGDVLASTLVEYSTLDGAPAHLNSKKPCCDEAGLARSVPESGQRLSFFKTGYWLKFSALAPNSVLEISPIVDRASLFWRDAKTGEWQRSVSGDHVTMAKRSLPRPEIVLPVGLADPLSPMFLHVKNSSFVSVGFYVSTRAEFDEKHASNKAIKLILLGFIGAIACYNLVVSLLLRDLIFLLNAVVVFSLLIVSVYLSGYGAAYIWTHQPLAGELTMTLALVVAVCVGMFFMVRFLRYEKGRGSDHRLLYLPVPIAAVAGVLAVFMPYQYGRHLVLVASFIALAVMTVVLTRRVMRGDRQGKILAVPFVFGVFPGASLAAAHNLADIDLGVLTQSALEIFLAFEALLFSLAIASRIHTAEKGKIQALETLRLARERAASRILSAQDQERKRVAQDIHDSAGQGLLSLINLLKISEKSVDKTGVGRGHFLTEAQAEARRILDDLRRISRNMHPATLDHLGWQGAVDAMFESLGERADMRCRAVFDLDEKQLDGEQQLHLYRIIQECLSNVVRHAEASRCDASFVIRHGVFQLEITDNGLAAALPSDPLKGGGLGLTSINERVHILGGQWRIEAAPNGGTRITMTMPLKPSTTAHLDESQ